jgi:hypothetical protein
MPTRKHWLIIGAAALTGFVLANAPTGTGIYSTPIGQTLANIYTFGRTKAGVAAATTVTPTAPSAPVTPVGS